MTQIFNTLEITGITFERLLRFLPSNTQQKTYSLKIAPKGKKIYPLFQNGKKVFLVKSGRVKISGIEASGQEWIQRIAWNGELFGEMALLHQQPANEYAQALDTIEYYEISTTALRKLMQQNWMVQIQVLEYIAKRYEDAQKRLKAQLCEDTRTRIITLLLDLATQRGQAVGKYGLLLQPFLQQADIAALAGCSLPAVGLVLRELKMKKLISCGKHQLRIYNRSQLKFAINGG